jgi:hypothetical protein
VSNLIPKFPILLRAVAGRISRKDILGFSFQDLDERELILRIAGSIDETRQIVGCYETSGATQRWPSQDSECRRCPFVVAVHVYFIPDAICRPPAQQLLPVGQA